VDLFHSGKPVCESKNASESFCEYLRELKLPDNTIHLSSESYPLEVKGNNTDYVKEPIWNERFKGNIAMWKEDDSNPGRMLEGAQYEVRDKDGLLYCTMVTDKDGYALSIDLPVGTYYVREVVPPAGFILSDEVIEVKITTDDKNTIVFERDNTPNHVVLKKSDLTTGKPVPDAMIEIKNEKGDVIFEGETDLNGEIILYELPAGKYTYKETVAADGYAINDETFTFTVDYYGKVILRGKSIQCADGQGGHLGFILSPCCQLPVCIGAFVANHSFAKGIKGFLLIFPKQIGGHVLAPFRFCLYHGWKAANLQFAFPNLQKK